MSATVMRYTSAWASLVPAIKSTIGLKLADVKVGVGLNFNALDAVEKHEAGAVSGGLFGALIGSGSRGGLRVPIPPIDATGVRDLLSNTVDFVGISAYAPYSGAGFPAREFENSAFNVGDALRSLAAGLDLASLAASGRLELHYSEFGIGGGTNGNGAQAPLADAAARQPWAGITGSYSAGRDPWRRADLAAFRDAFYGRALEWLSAPNSGTYRIHEVFVWGMASWDLFATYPDSSSAEGSFRGEGVVKAIARHNAAVIAAQVCARQGPEHCNAHVTAEAACLSADGDACLAVAAPAASRRR
jgi:hypothetical protein